MENFVVSARKYRPDSFDNVIGQSHITTTLKNAVKDSHLAHAFLFCGPRGVGKTTCARILAKTINCKNLTPETEACNQCESCVSFINNASFNIHELDAASNNSVDDIRNLVDQMRYAPQSGKYKIYIIDEVHMLSTNAFNAFLKTLEEPPSHAIFILATTEKHKIIPTILSRCQIYDFSRIQLVDIVTHLNEIAEKEGIKTEPEALHLIAQKADGALRDALSLFDLIATFSSDNQVTYKDTIENLHILDYDYYFKMTDYLTGENISEALLIYDEVLRNGFDGHNFIVGLSEHFRDLLVCKDDGTIKLLQVSDNIKKRYQEQAKNTPLSFLMTALNIVSQCDINYKISKNQRLHVELALMKMAHINQAVNLLEHQQSQKETKEEQNKNKAPGSEKIVTSEPPLKDSGGMESAKYSVPDSKKDVSTHEGEGESENTHKSEVKEQETEYQPSSSVNKTGQAVQPHQAPEAQVEHQRNPDKAGADTTPSIPNPIAPDNYQHGSESNTSFKDTIKITDFKKYKSQIRENADRSQENTAGKGDSKAPPSALSRTFGREGVGGASDKPVTQEQIQKTWDSYAQKKKTEGKMNEHTILAGSKITVDNHIISLQLDNQVQLDQFSEFKSDLLKTLRKESGNAKIMVEAKIMPHNPQKKIYTDREKFTYLSEKYPLLNEMKEKFGLETDM
ncbi:MAG: DNA polymerase III subunit gamma/tau [Cytophagales bacterium]|nr:DNA polymerase III subunit gamma/tau [Cytophagales bacterium]